MKKICILFGVWAIANSVKLNVNQGVVTYDGVQCYETASGLCSRQCHKEYIDDPTCSKWKGQYNPNDYDGFDYPAFEPPTPPEPYQLYA